MLNLTEYLQSSLHRIPSNASIAHSPNGLRVNRFLMAVLFLCSIALPVQAASLKAPKTPAKSETTQETPTKKKQAPKHKMFALDFSGYLLMGFRMTANDPKQLRLGESDGFYVSRARLKVAARIWQFTSVLSLDGAFDRSAEPLDVSPSTRRLFVELRDAFIQYRHPSGFFAQIGQSKVPFGMHADRSTTSEHFILFPLIAVGEDVAFGYQVRGIMPGRDIGLTLGFRRQLGSIDLQFQAMVYNGNGANTFANDSDLPAVAGRISVGIGSFLKIGGSVLWNQRRVGRDPNLFDESDLAFSADLALRVAGFFLEGEFAARNTSYPTTGQNTAFGFGFRVDAGYRIQSIGLEFVARFEMYDPTDLFNDDQLMYITPGINWYYRIWKTHEIAVRLSYTIKLEQTPARSLNNDQFNLLVQYHF